MSRLHPGTPHHHFRSWAVASVLACSSWWAQAVSLGPVAVSSGIGQPLRASIAITQFKVEDLRQLQVRLADAASFQQAGISVHPALNGLQVSLAFRGNGEPVIALVGQVPVTENFLDLIVEAQWPSGRLAMNYTLLVSPLGALPDAATPVMSPVVDPQALVAPTVAAQSPGNANPSALTVRAGDTALKLVLAQRPAGVSLAQMLVAMVRANPEAFIEGNVNLLREGAEIQMPSVQEAAQISAEEARQTVLAQNADFANYARRLAQSALKAQGSASREMVGQVKPATETTPPAPAGQDKLTLSQRAITPNSDEARWAVEQEIKEKTAQLAALKKNLDDLQSLAAKTNTTTASSSPSPKSQSNSWSNSANVKRSRRSSDPIRTVFSIECRRRRERHDIVCCVSTTFPGFAGPGQPTPHPLGLDGWAVGRYGRIGLWGAPSACPTHRFFWGRQRTEHCSAIALGSACTICQDRPEPHAQP